MCHRVTGTRCGRRGRARSELELPGDPNVHSGLQVTGQRHQVAHQLRPDQVHRRRIDHDAQHTLGGLGDPLRTELPPAWASRPGHSPVHGRRVVQTQARRCCAAVVTWQKLAATASCAVQGCAHAEQPAWASRLVRDPGGPMCVSAIPLPIIPWVCARPAVSDTPKILATVARSLILRVVVSSTVSPLQRVGDLVRRFRVAWR